MAKDYVQIETDPFTEGSSIEGWMARYEKAMQELKRISQAPDEMTGAEMCETIEGVRRMVGLKPQNPMDIWNASPTGELAHVFTGFNDAMLFLGNHGLTVADAIKKGKEPF